MASIINYKRINNKTCAATTSSNPVFFRIVFPLGFSAWFCSRCSEQLIREGLRVKEQKNNAIDKVVEPAPIAIGTTTSEDSKEDVS